MDARVLRLECRVCTKMWLGIRTGGTLCRLSLTASNSLRTADSRCERVCERVRVCVGDIYASVCFIYMYAYMSECVARAND